MMDRDAMLKSAASWEASAIREATEMDLALGTRSSDIAAKFIIARELRALAAKDEQGEKS